MNNDDLTMKVLGKLDDLTLEIKALRSDTSDNKRDINLLSLDMRINNRAIKAMQTDLSDLKSDVRTLKTDVSELKTDVSELKIDVSKLKEDVDGLKSSVRHLELLHEETDENIKEILEIAGPNTKQIITLKKYNETQDEKLQFHERRIGFLEKKVA